MSKFTITVGVMLLLSGSFAPFVLSGSQSQSSISDLTESFAFQGGFQQVEKHISFSAPEIKEDGDFTTIAVPESTSYMTDAGKPMLPYYTQTMTFPVGTEIVDVEFTFSPVQKTNIHQKVMPAPEPVPLDMDYENHCITTEMDKDVYSSFAPYPDKWSDYNIGRGLDKGERVIFLSLSVFPVRYTPGLDNIQYLEDVDIVVKYKPKASNSGTATNDSYELVIITPQEFYDALQPLVDHKINNMSISTKIVKTDGIYYWDYFQVHGRDRAEQIKNFIKNAYDQWNTKYVLLVGGKKNYSSADDWWIPVRRINIELSSGIYNSISDLYYADLYDGNGTFCSWDANHNDLFGNGKEDNVDLCPDVYLGRLPCVNENEVITMVNKIITYETQSQSAWFNRMILCGGDTHITTLGFSSNEGEYIQQEILNFMETAYQEKSFIGIKLWVSLNSLTTGNIIKEIDRGAGFISFSGHGGETAWCTYSKSYPMIYDFLNKDIDKLGDNNGGYPVAIIHACNCGDFSYTQPCFAWKLIKHQNGGAIAGCACTDVSWSHASSPPTTSVGGLQELCTFKSYINGSQTFGEMWGGSINLYLDKRMGKYFGNLEYCLLEEWQPFGDPSLRLKSLGDSAPENNNPPSEPGRPSGSSSEKAGIKLTFNSSTTDLEGDDIYYLFDWGDGTDSGYLGPYKSGETAQATHLWKKDGVFQVKVKALDMHGFESPWSEPFDVSISYWNNKVCLIGRICDKEEIDGSIHFYSTCSIPIPKLIYIDLIPFEVNRYESGVLFSVESQNHGFISFRGYNWVFGRFNLRFLVE